MKSPESSTGYVTKCLSTMPKKRCNTVTADETESHLTAHTDHSRLTISERKHRIKIGAATGMLDLVIKYNEIMLKEVSATGADTVMSGLSGDIREVTDMLFELKECLLERDETATRAISQMLPAS